jgi:hypothetical protein
LIAFSISTLFAKRFYVMQLPIGMFDPTKIAPATGEAGSLPASDSNGHVCVIVGEEIKNVAGKDSEFMLVLELQIVEGPYAGQTGPYRLNIGNSSAEAVRIALSQLSAICHVVGWLQPLTETSVLRNKKFRVVVVPAKKEEDRNKGYTEIKKVLNLDGTKPGEGKAPQQASAPAPAPQAPVAQPQQQFAPQPQQFADPALAQQFAPQPQPQQQPLAFAPQAPQQQFAPQQGVPFPGQPAPFAAPASAFPTAPQAAPGGGVPWAKAPGT